MRGSRTRYFVPSAVASQVAQEIDCILDEAGVDGRLAKGDLIAACSTSRPVQSLTRLLLENGAAEEGIEYAVDEIYTMSRFGKGLDTVACWVASWLSEPHVPRVVFALYSFVEGQYGYVDLLEELTSTLGLFLALRRCFDFLDETIADVGYSESETPIRFNEILSWKHKLPYDLSWFTMFSLVDAVCSKPCGWTSSLLPPYRVTYGWEIERTIRGCLAKAALNLSDENLAELFELSPFNVLKG